MLSRFSAVTKRIGRVEKKILAGRIHSRQKVAVFDLDNTLIVHDIGEAVFARLKQIEERKPLTVDRKPIPLTWSEYRYLVRKGRKRQAYTRMVTAMAGIPLETLLETTREILDSKAPAIEIEGQMVPVPRVNPRMQDLVRFLKELHYRIFVISASNQASVRETVERLLGIDGSCAWGIRSGIKPGKWSGQEKPVPVLTADLETPVPIGQGKVSVYKKFIASFPPLVTAGDSELDIPMLNLTHPQGLSIWAGKRLQAYREAKSRLKHPGTLVRLGI